ncbi:MAG: hypothetical protein HGB20_01500 [Chlorobiaceae bacterium]|nr:hypothetical protein [Chlorobiaceae bacterium]
MNKILTVGHPFSGYRDVEGVLRSWGMQPARTSKRECLCPVEIGSILRQAHGEVSLESIQKSDELRQIDAGPVWHGLALDLLLNNIDQKFWGWSDPEAIYLLDYWKALDPQMAFVLVYDEPHRVLAETSCDEARFYSRSIIEQRLDNWNAYNSALLGFHLQNSGRSMLVNAKQVRKRADECKNKLMPYFDDTVSQSGHLPYIGFFNYVSCPNGSNGEGGRESYALSKNAMTVPALADGFLIESILADYPEHLHRYDELQSSATIPLEPQPIKQTNSLDAWLVQMKRRSESGRVIAILSEGKKIAEEQLLVKDNELEDSFRRETLLHRLLTSEREDFEKKVYLFEEKLREKQNDFNAVSEKNKLLIDEKTELDKRQKALLEEKKSIENNFIDLQGQIDIQKNESISNSRTKKELIEENELLLLQLHEVQEELERYYLENQKLKPQQQSEYYGAADRLKRELPYRLGAEIIERSRKIWPLLFLPISLPCFTRQYRNHKNKSDIILPPLEEYRDFFKAEKAQKHLSYRLGVTWLKHCRTPWGWVVMPFALNSARQAYHEYRKSVVKQDDRHMPGL